MPNELYKFLAPTCVELTNLAFTRDDVVWLSWKQPAEDCVPNLRHIREFIGVSVTDGAGIHLYDYLEQLRENAKYCCTDSVI